MSLTALPTISHLDDAQNFRWTTRMDALDPWTPELRAAGTGENTINIYGVIGEDLWSEDEITLKVVQSQLEGMTGDVVVNINSPGGDYFEGVGIYNALRRHDGKVTANIMGLAASAASVIAMAADEIMIADNASFMLHKAWTVTVGNADDCREASRVLDKFDASIAKVYDNRMELGEDKILAMISNDYWTTGQEAVDAGLADGILAEGSTVKAQIDGKQVRAVAIADASLRAFAPQMSRSERRALQADMRGGKPSAAATVTPRADAEVLASLKTLASTISK